MESKIRVIICDDHSLFRQGVKSALSYKNDIKVVAEAVDGVDLLNKLNFTETDIILLDINMPRMDGMAVLPILKSNEKYKDIKVIILSMHNQMSMISKMMGMGANSYLTKSDDSEIIYEAIKSCYEKDYYFNDLTNKSLLTMVKKNPNIFMEDEEYIETENRRKLKIKTQSQVEQPTKVKSLLSSITKGVIMGVVSVAVVLLVWFFMKIANNMELTNYIPQP